MHNSGTCYHDMPEVRKEQVYHILAQLNKFSWYQNKITQSEKFRVREDWDGITTIFDKIMPLGDPDDIDLYNDMIF